MTRCVSAHGAAGSGHASRRSLRGERAASVHCRLSLATFQHFSNTTVKSPTSGLPGSRDFPHTPRAAGSVERGGARRIKIQASYLFTLPICCSNNIHHRLIEPRTSLRSESLTAPRGRIHLAHRKRGSTPTCENNQVKLKQESVLRRVLVRESASWTARLALDQPRVFAGTLKGSRRFAARDGKLHLMDVECIDYFSSEMPWNT